MAPTDAWEQFIGHLGRALADVRGAWQQVVVGLREKPAGTSSPTIAGVGLAFVLKGYAAWFLATRKLVPVLEDWSPRFAGYFCITQAGGNIQPDSLR